MEKTTQLSKGTETEIEMTNAQKVVKTQFGENGRIKWQTIIRTSKT